jgi:hypothetical protein
LVSSRDYSYVANGIADALRREYFSARTKPAPK